MKKQLAESFKKSFNSPLIKFNECDTLNAGCRGRIHIEKSEKTDFFFFFFFADVCVPGKRVSDFPI